MLRIKVKQNYNGTITYKYTHKIKMYSKKNKNKNPYTKTIKELWKYGRVCHLYQHHVVLRDNGEKILLCETATTFQYNSITIISMLIEYNMLNTLFILCLLVLLTFPYHRIH